MHHLYSPIKFCPTLQVDTNGALHQKSSSGLKAAFRSRKFVKLTPGCKNQLVGNSKESVEYDITKL